MESFNASRSKTRRRTTQHQLPADAQVNGVNARISRTPTILTDDEEHSADKEANYSVSIHSSKRELEVQSTKIIQKAEEIIRQRSGPEEYIEIDGEILANPKPDAAQQSHRVTQLHVELLKPSHVSPSMPDQEQLQANIRAENFGRLDENFKQLESEGCCNHAVHHRASSQLAVREVTTSS